jgi:hypothetical protein
MKIHPVCKMCVNECKKPYGEWSKNVPGEEFCDKFEEINRK